MRKIGFFDSMANSIKKLKRSMELIETERALPLQTNEERRLYSGGRRDTRNSIPDR